MSVSVNGGCLCGALRYTSTPYKVDLGRFLPLKAAADSLLDASERTRLVQDKAVNYCHCRLCQKANGAPVVAFTWVPKENFKFAKGTPQRYASSDKGERLFCG